jgi:hypothetical protein
MMPAFERAAAAAARSEPQEQTLPSAETSHPAQKAPRRLQGALFHPQQLPAEARLLWLLLSLALLCR